MTLTQLEGDDWGPPPSDATGLVASVHRLRHVPVADLDAGALRVLLGQRVGVEFLVPRAIAVLRDEPLVEGSYYPGDLLVAVLSLPADYWAAHPGERAEMAELIAGLDVPDKTVRAAVEAFGQR